MAALTELTKHANMRGSSIYVQGEVVSLRQQISNFALVTLPDLRAQLRGAAATAADHRIKHQDSFQRCYLSKCLFIIGTGGNDYLLNYFNPRKNGTEGGTGTPSPEFTRSLITKLSHHLQVLPTSCLQLHPLPWLMVGCSCSSALAQLAHGNKRVAVHFTV